MIKIEGEGEFWLLVGGGLRFMWHAWRVAVGMIRWKDSCVEIPEGSTCTVCACRDISGEDFLGRIITKHTWQECKMRIISFLFLGRYAMKCLDKKRIKMKQGETLALNERIMLSLVSTGVSLATLSSGKKEGNASDLSLPVEQLDVCVEGGGDRTVACTQREEIGGMQSACNQSCGVLVDTAGIQRVCWPLAGKMMWAGGGVEHVAGSVISAVS